MCGSEKELQAQGPWCGLPCLFIHSPLEGQVVSVEGDRDWRPSTAVIPYEASLSEHCYYRWERAAFIWKHGLNSLLSFFFPLPFLLQWCFWIVREVMTHFCIGKHIVTFPDSSVTVFFLSPLQYLYPLFIFSALIEARFSFCKCLSLEVSWSHWIGSRNAPTPPPIWTAEAEHWKWPSYSGFACPQFSACFLWAVTVGRVLALGVDTHREKWMTLAPPLVEVL